MAKDAAVDYKQQLIQRIQTKQAVVAIYGLGYVGLPLALRFSQAGYRVLGFDTDSTKVDKLNRGQSYIERIKPAAIAAAQAAGFIASADYARSAAADALIICVPTPLGKHRNPDLSFVLDTVEGMRGYLRAGQVVCLESTTYPGTSEEEILPRIQSQGLRVGEECFLVYSPEREDPGNPHFHTQIIPKVCGGYSEHCLAVGVKLYSAVIDQVVAVSSLQTAEMTKLLENIYRAVNIGLVNELKIVADKMHIDIREVIAAAATKPFGFVPFYPGAGLGGHCIPIDPFYLTWKARELGINTRFIELAGEVNAYMPEWVIDKIIGALNAQKKAVNAAPILVLGVAYKKNVDDMRESPSLYIMQRLRDLGAHIAYSDPHIPKLPKLRNYDFDLHSVNLTPARLRTYAAVVLLTPHDLFDFDHIGQHARLIIDAHGVIPPTANAIVVRA